jgi:hypothetical protein
VAGALSAGALSDVPLGSWSHGGRFGWGGGVRIRRRAVAITWAAAGEGAGSWSGYGGGGGSDGQSQGQPRFDNRQTEQSRSYRDRGRA